MDEGTLLRLASLLYEGIISPAGWSDALAQLARATGSQAASLVLWDRNEDHARVGDQFGLPAEMMQAYAADYHRLDPGRHFVDRVATGEWYLDERELGPVAMRRSAFYQDFLGRYELDSTMASPFLRLPSGLQGFLSLGSRAGARDLAATVRALRPLMPHLERAAALRMKLIDLSTQAGLQAAMLNRLNFPVLAITSEARVVQANRAAEAWLLQPGSPLAASSPRARDVTRMLRSACGIGQPALACGLRWRKPDGGEYFLLAVPLPAASDIAWANQGPTALLLVSDPAQARPDASAVLRQMFGLTAAELRVLGQLLQGATLQEAAAALDVSIATARTHLKSVFSKLGIRRQADLARMLGDFALVATT
jgi:DNA-binding CsgD family transcriptional regulator